MQEANLQVEPDGNDAGHITAEEERPDREDLPFGPFFRRAAAAVGLALAAVVGVVFLWKIAKAVLLAFAGILLAVILHGLASRLQRSFPASYRLALGLTIAGLLVVLGLFTWWMAPRVVAELDQLTGALPQIAEQAERQLRSYDWGVFVLRHLPASERFIAPGPGVWTRVTGYVSTAVEVAGGLLVVVAMGIFVAASPGRYRRGIVRLVPIAARERAREVLAILARALWDWVTAQLVAMLIVAVLTWAGLSLLGVELALGLAVVNGLFEFVPIVGPWIGAVPGVLVALAGDPGQALWVALMYFGIQQVESNLITPLVMRRAARLPAALTLLSTIVAGILFGLLGIFLATPLMLTVVVMVQTLYVEDVLGDHGVAPDW